MTVSTNSFDLVDAVQIVRALSACRITLERQVAQGELSSLHQDFQKRWLTEMVRCASLGMKSAAICLEFSKASDSKLFKCSINARRARIRRTIDDFLRGSGLTPRYFDWKVGRGAETLEVTVAVSW